MVVSQHQLTTMSVVLAVPKVAGHNKIGLPLGGETASSIKIHYGC